jgi:hypothetical protein
VIARFHKSVSKRRLGRRSNSGEYGWFHPRLHPCSHVEDDRDFAVRLAAKTIETTTLQSGKCTERNRYRHSKIMEKAEQLPLSFSCVGLLSTWQKRSNTRSPFHLFSMPADRRHHHNSAELNIPFPENLRGDLSATLWYAILDNNRHTVRYLW